MPTREAVKNGILNQLDVTFLEDRALAKPSVNSIAVSTVCDLQCPHCMREALGIRENKFMDYEALAAHRADLAQARRITLFGLGEPFLHPRFFDFITLAKSLGVWVSTSTHGMSLTPENRVKVIESGLDELNISMDGADEKVFNELRKGADFGTVVERVTAMARLRAKRGTEHPVLNVNMTVLRRNLRQVPLMVRLAHRMGCQSVSFSSVVIYQPEDKPQSVVDTPEFERTFEKARRLARRLGIDMTFWRQKPFGWEPDIYHRGGSYGCVVLSSDQIIDRDGRMKMCCYIEEDVADVFEEGPLAAFNSARVVSQRRALREGRVRNECQGCMYLRERSPSWIQANLNLAARKTFEADSLTDEDRRELIGKIAEYQAIKDALYPGHAYTKIAETAAPVQNGDSHGMVTSERAESDLPVY